MKSLGRIFAKNGSSVCCQTSKLFRSAESSCLGKVEELTALLRDEMVMTTWKERKTFKFSSSLVQNSRMD